MAFEVISADNHINEPPHVFDNVPAKLKGRTPRMMRGADGGDGWSFDGGPPKRTFGIETSAGRSPEEFQLSGLKFEEIMKGNWDGEAHLEDMRIDGVEAAVVYPAHAIFTYIAEDRELGIACMRSYNDWVIGEFQAVDPTRLVGLALLPSDDGMDVCLAEVERVAKLGAKGLFIPGMPARPYNDPYYEPLWAAAADVNLPLSFHRTFGGKPADQDWDELVEQKVSVAGIVNRFFCSVRPLTYMIFAGIFERHPNLKLVAAEVNFGWLPFWIETMDEEFTRQKAWSDAPLKSLPSQAIGKNVFVTVLDDRVGFDLLRAGSPRLEDAVMFSSDYPHSVTLWPKSQEHIARLTVGLDPEVRHKVLAGNAERVYGFGR